MIRHAEEKDIEQIEALYARARMFMAAHGNAGQWGTAYPQRELILEDFARGELYVDCAEDGVIDCVFMFTMRPEPTYTEIEGAWLCPAKTDKEIVQGALCKPYGTVHRVASSGRRKGAASACIQWCYEVSGRNMRGDTHENNHIMQHVFEKNGFQRCGIIYVEKNTADKSPRIAYQRTE